MSSLKLALRSLAKTPGFTLIAVVTLALGIGLNTAMFSLVNSVLLRPRPFPDSEQLVRLHRTTPETRRGGFSPADFIDLERGASDFGRFAAYDNANVSVSEPGKPAEFQNALRVSSGYFEVLKIQPALGRTFRSEEFALGRHRVVILSDALWRDRFARAPDIVGRTIRIAGEPYEVVGVLPASANDGRIIRQVGLFYPLSFTDGERATRDRPMLNVVGRRLPTLSAAQGEAFIAAFGARLAAAFPKEHAGSGWRSESLHRSTANASGRAVMAMLLGLSGFVLLIACSNLANCLLARVLARTHELAVRSALGASRLRLIRPFVIESLLLAAVGGVGALFVALWATRWLSDQTVAGGGSLMEFPMDWRVLGFASMAALLTALFFGVVPAFLASRTDVNHALKSGARTATAGRSHHRLRQMLVIGQFALAMVLLGGAGFFVRGAGNLLKQQFGWDLENIVIGAVDLPKSAYAGPAEIAAFHRLAFERLAQLPGVQAVSVSYAAPVQGLPGPRRYVVQGRELPPKGQEPAASFNGISPTYFEVTGTRLLSGRAFNDADSATSPNVVIINDAMARALFPDENPLGRRIARAGTEVADWAEIVGVVANVSSVGVYREPVAFQVYHPFVQEPSHSALLAVRFSGVAPEAMLAPIRAAITRLDPDLPVRDLMPMETSMQRAAFDLQMLQKMLGAFALLGLALAGLGIYGVLERTVAQRTGEIGIRMALGAQVADVIRLVLGFGLRLALIGAGLGLFGAFGLSLLLASVMPAMQIDGGLVLAAAGVVLVILALVACYLPARTAANVDPLVALRTE
ncbi:MAG TPA: ABC transporter permease [Opitutus sp.]|nr:ABC transporter permease [Opitutus sp.]